MTVAFSLYAALNFYGDQVESNKSSADTYQIAAQQIRFAGLKQELPPRTVVGYVSDVSIQPGAFLSAQYALAPVILVEDDTRELVIGNFSRPMDYAGFGRSRHLTVVKDFSNGVVLFRKAS